MTDDERRENAAKAIYALCGIMGEGEENDD